MTVASSHAVVVGAQTDSEPETRGGPDSSEREDDTTNPEHSLQGEHARPQGAPPASEGRGTSSHGSGDHAAAMGNVLGAALTYQLRQPDIYRALGMDHPPTSIPVSEADRWLESWHVIASSVPSQQAKLSKIAAQSSTSM